jgi:hypothetical protein
MLKTFTIIGVLITLFFTNKAFSQTGNDTVKLLNGSVVIGTVIDTSGGFTTLKNPKPNAKKDIVIENDRIFSVSNPSGETMVYVYDTLLGNEFTIEEMRYFIKGEQDAEKNRKCPGAFWGNMAIGAVSAPTLGFLGVIPPFAYTALSGWPKIKIKSNTVSNIEYLKQPAYIMGYDRVVQKNRKMKSLIGGAIGLGIGFTTYFILHSTGNKVGF